MKARWLCIATAALLVVSAVLAQVTGTPAAKAPQPQALALETLAKKSGCFECHSVDKKVVGPAYRDVAARYKDDPKARAALIETVKKGGKGHWSDITNGVPMPPYSGRLSAAEITRLVDWVLSFKDGEPK